MKYLQNNKWTILSLIILLSVLFPAQALAAVSDFRYCAPITVDDSSASYNLLELTDEILGQSQVGSSDLRIYNGDEEIPYALVTEQDFASVINFERVKILNQGEDIQGNLQFEVHIPAGQWLRELVIISPDKNFIRQVKVEGSRNQLEWLVLSEDSTIFDLTNERKERHLEINLAPTNLPYLRITIYNEGKGSFNFEGVSLSTQNQNEAVAVRRERPFTLLTQSSKEGIQEYILDLHQPNLPSREWEIVTEEVNFNRTAELYASKNNKDWHLIAKGEFFAYRLDKLTAKQLVLKFNTNLRYLKLKINNHDNSDLGIQVMHIYGSNPHLVFPTVSTKETALYWGNSQIKGPVYDIQKFKSNLEYSKTPRAVLGQVGENKGYKFKDNRPWTERNAWLLQGILVMVVVALLLIIILSIRKISSEKE